ncbi:unnamed protein product [Rotaria magnacalcarata]|uniref:Uncharacterized protein n=1 Tax=Rotaria magnacalcarata TaxID=392030 RepID=A0A819XYH0_9BILA|nr:unnamed protein product [Rotaria magnacalcarata]CAF2054885.1 unnamed protein product [Rotaria magnacalcarata]CAF2128357.1 unnamed protein product [Rotaria magnacalcarata]CAF4149377.1 unnamed protein product [Rotaria magnacalcarata]CAF4382449.1 unnamed protein product [Rotaria magnacalcarata]
MSGEEVPRVVNDPVRITQQPVATDPIKNELSAADSEEAKKRKRQIKRSISQSFTSSPYWCDEWARCCCCICCVTNDNTSSNGSTGCCDFSCCDCSCCECNDCDCSCCDCDGCDCNGCDCNGCDCGGCDCNF